MGSASSGLKVVEGSFLALIPPALAWAAGFTVLQLISSVISPLLSSSYSRLTAEQR